MTDETMLEDESQYPETYIDDHGDIRLVAEYIDELVETISEQIIENLQTTSTTTSTASGEEPLDSNRISEFRSETPQTVSAMVREALGNLFSSTAYADDELRRKQPPASSKSQRVESNSSAKYEQEAPIVKVLKKVIEVIRKDYVQEVGLMSDEELSEEFKKIDFWKFWSSGKNRQIHNEYYSRFHGEEHREAVGHMINPFTRMVIEQATGHDFGIMDDPAEQLLNQRIKLGNALGNKGPNKNLKDAFRDAFLKKEPSQKSKHSSQVSSSSSSTSSTTTSTSTTKTSVAPSSADTPLLLEYKPNAVANSTNKPQSVVLKPQSSTPSMAGDLMTTTNPIIHSKGVIVPKHAAGDLASSKIQELIDINTGVVRIVPKNYPGNLNKMREIDVANWPASEQYVNQVESVVGKCKWVYNDNIKGIKTSTTDGYHIRIDKGNPLAEHPTQVVDHIAISHKGNVVDHTGLNFIFYDSEKREMYKISRENFDAGRRQISNRFDITKNPKKIETSAHPDAHIPADTWLQWQHPGHPTASPAVSKQLGHVVTEELIDIDSALGNTKIKTSTTSTSTSSTNSNSSSSSGSGGTKRSAVEQKDNEQQNNEDNNKVTPVDTTKDSEQDQDQPSPSTVAADYLDYVLWWVDHITPEWIQERVTNSQPIKDIAKHFKQYDHCPVIEIIAKDELSKEHEQQHATTKEEEKSSIIDHAEVHYNQEDELHKPETNSVLAKETLAALPIATLVDNHENCQALVADHRLSEKLGNEEMLEEQIIDTIPCPLVSNDAKNKQDTTLTCQADSETSSADNAAAIIVANFLLKHIIDTYICLDALVSSVVESTGADLGVEPIG